MNITIKDPVPGLDYNAIFHVVVGWSRGLHMIHLCIFHTYQVSGRYASVYTNTMEEAVKLISMLNPESVTIQIDCFDATHEYRKQVAEMLS